MSEQIARCEERIRSLETWQKRQNGSLSKIDERLHSLERWIMATLAAALVSVLLNIAGRVTR